MISKILVSSYTDEIYTLEFDAEKRSLVQTGATKVGERPSWATLHPQDPSILYTVLETDESRLLALKDGQIVDNVATNGAAACTIHIKDDELFVPNYTSGQLFVIPISTSPPYFAPELVQTIQFTGSGPNKARQERAHAHDALIYKSDLLVPDLGTDRIHRLKKSSGGQWEVFDAIHLPPGTGPRHIAFHENTLYVLLELSNQIAAIPYAPKDSDKPVIVDTSEEVKEGVMTAAELRIDYPYLYASNRDSGHQEGDSIAVFRIDGEKGLERVNEVRTGMTHVRGIALGGPENRYLIAGGVTGGGVKVYERKDKDLLEVAALTNIAKPTSFVWV